MYYNTESGAACNDDETLVANGFCVHVNEDRNYNDVCQRVVHSQHTSSGSEVLQIAWVNIPNHYQQ